MPIINGKSYINSGIRSKGKCYISSCTKFFLKSFYDKQGYVAEYKLGSKLIGDDDFIPPIEKFFENDLYYIKYPFYKNSSNLYSLCTDTKSINNININYLFYNCINHVEKIHKLNYLHLDIKPENFIVIDSDINNLRLFDMEFSEKMFGEKKKIKRRRGTKSYIAPEVYKYFVGYKTDVWGLGIIYYILKNSSFPYCHYRNDNELCVKKTDLLKYCTNDNVTNDILDMTIVENYNERCSLQDLKHYMEREVLA
jgi:serine/threonine protein kinase